MLREALEARSTDGGGEVVGPGGAEAADESVDEDVTTMVTQVNVELKKHGSKRARWQYRQSNQRCKRYGV